MAAWLARGDYLLFMDDDNVAEPHEVSTLVRGRRARRGGPDGLFRGHLRGRRRAATVPPAEVQQHTFLGPAVALGLWRNVLGDTNTLMRREAFVALGGFTEDYGVGHEDHELLVRAVGAASGWKWSRRRYSGIGALRKASNKVPTSPPTSCAFCGPTWRQCPLNYGLPCSSRRA